MNSHVSDVVATEVVLCLDKTTDNGESLYHVLGGNVECRTTTLAFYHEKLRRFPLNNTFTASKDVQGHDLYELTIVVDGFPFHVSITKWGDDKFSARGQITRVPPPRENKFPYQRKNWESLRNTVLSPMAPLPHTKTYPGGYVQFSDPYGTGAYLLVKGLLSEKQAERYVMGKSKTEPKPKPGPKSKSKSFNPFASE